MNVTTEMMLEKWAELDSEKACLLRTVKPQLDALDKQMEELEEPIKYACKSAGRSIASAHARVEFVKPGVKVDVDTLERAISALAHLAEEYPALATMVEWFEGCFTVSKASARMKLTKEFEMVAVEVTSVEMSEIRRAS